MPRKQSPKGKKIEKTKTVKKVVEEIVPAMPVPDVAPEASIALPIYRGKQVVEVLERGELFYRCRMEDLTTQDVPVGEFA